MNRSLDALRADLEVVQSLLARGGLSVFREEDQNRLSGTVADLGRKLDDFSDSFLTVGLLGGTGVGKSTLMNALAGAEIASAAHRRPHTDRVLVYRHRSVVLPPPLVRSQVPWDDRVHEANGIRQIVLCDMPDFDSLVTLHFRRVLDFLENLDLLIWVVSPEKYADERFYRFLGEVPQARENYLFLINKTDQLFVGPELEDGYRKLAVVIRTFQQHLVARRMEKPVIFAVSAADALREAQTAVWNQFPAFRQQLFRERDTKEVGAIKAANLHQEMEALLAVFDRKMVEIQKLRAILESTASGLMKEQTDWASSGRLALGLWLEEDLRPSIRSKLYETSALEGAGAIAQALVQRLETGTTVDLARSPCDLRLQPDGPLGRLDLEWGRIEHRMTHDALQGGVETPLVSHLKECFDPEARRIQWSRKTLQTVESRVRDATVQSVTGFRWLQRISYGLLTLLLILGLLAHGWELMALRGGESQPALLVLAGFARVLFSSEGLTALTSYAMLLFLLGFRFQASQKKRLQHLEQKIIETLKSDLGIAWDAELEAIVHQLNACSRNLEKEVEEISNLRERRRRD